MVLYEIKRNSSFSVIKLTQVRLRATHKQKTLAKAVASAEAFKGLHN